jgi:hypothetical protein
MDLWNALKELNEERERLDKVIATLEALKSGNDLDTGKPDARCCGASKCPRHLTTESQIEYECLPYRARSDARFHLQV